MHLWSVICQLSLGTICYGYTGNAWVAVPAADGTDEPRGLGATAQFLRSLLSAVSRPLLMSTSVMPLYTVWFQAARSMAWVSQLSVQMLQLFRSLLQASLKQSEEQLTLPVPLLIMMSFGILPSFMWQTCPSHHRWCWLSREYMLGILACSRMSWCWMQSCHFIPRMRLTCLP